MRPHQLYFERCRCTLNTSHICLLSVPEHEIPFWNLARVLPNGHTQLVYGGLLKFAYEPNVLFQLPGGTWKLLQSTSHMVMIHWPGPWLVVSPLAGYQQWKGWGCMPLPYCMDAPLHCTQTLKYCKLAELIPRYVG